MSPPRQLADSAPEEAPAPTVRRGRPPVAQARIVQELRSEIVGQRLAPGDRLPTISALTQRFGVAVATVQRALGHLQREGFVVSQRGSGTFVAPEPPCHHIIAVAFLGCPGGPQWNLFEEALRQAMVERGSIGHDRFEPYFGVLDNPPVGSDTQRLREAVATRRFKGLIFAMAPWPLTARHDALALPTPFPRVAFTSATPPNMPDVSFVTVDFGSFCDQACDHLLQRGRRQVAVLTTEVTDAKRHALLRDRLAARGLRLDPHGIQAVPHRDPRWAHNAVLALLRGHPRTDAIVTTDDHLDAGTLAAVKDSGLRVPADLDVIAYCNFPSIPARLPGVAYLGIDTHRILDAFVATIDRRRGGASDVSGSHVPFEFRPSEAVGQLPASAPIQWAHP